MVTDQILLNVVSVIFVDVEDDKLFRLVNGDLTAQLTADRASPACDENDLAADVACDAVHVDRDRITFQEVLNPDVTKLADADLAAYHLIDARQNPQPAAGALTDRYNIVAVLCLRAWNGDNNMSYLVLPGVLGNRIPPARNRNVADEPALLCAVIVDEAGDVPVQIPAADDFLQNDVSGIAGTDDHNLCRCIGVRSSVARAKESREAIHEAQSHEENKADQQVEYVIGTRHGKREDRHACVLERCICHDRQSQKHKLIDTGIFPHGTVQTKKGKNKKRGHCIDGRVHDQSCQILDRNARPDTVKTYPERQKAC